MESFMNDINNEGLRQDIRDLRVSIESGFTTLNQSNLDMATRITRLEERVAAVPAIQADLKEFKNVMQPVRDDVLVSKRIGRIALALAVFIPGGLAAWTPWKEDTKAQLIPIEAKLERQVNEVHEVSTNVRILSERVDKLVKHKEFNAMPAKNTYGSD
jgi:hypothetical protein